MFTIFKSTKSLARVGLRGILRLCVGLSTQQQDDAQFQVQELLSLRPLDILSDVLTEEFDLETFLVSWSNLTCWNLPTMFWHSNVSWKIAQLTLSSSPNGKFAKRASNAFFYAYAIDGSNPPISSVGVNLLNLTEAPSQAGRFLVGAATLVRACS
ncbi:hypothetical protein F511_38515 [Dorcoceras hygrometricum]|uniref:Uncharacterized protein n=1 Tax=Dorcoceras hygrometricum TaxID=472368 RepID=A0A2Z7BNE6_9LAMI|nr:hypothetical protein F511_38515 [Dorcoceras hygrometricum]